MKLDEIFMRRALALARRGMGRTSPNPCVGAVVVRAGQVIGEGWHRQAGGPHAEIEALRAARTPQGATLYVTLEPCCTHGRTPPCTDAILAAGIRRVVVAATDPNPRHRGRGLRLLRRAGVRVEAGLLAAEATALNAGFNTWITTGRPFVVAKAGVSLDGRIATRTGDSQWITSAGARRVGHQLRAQVDAIMVGAGTVLADDPRLTLRHGVRGRQPIRIVVDTRGRCPVSARLFRDGWPTWVVTGLRSAPTWRAKLAAQGVEVILLRTTAGHVNMRALVRELGRRQVTSVLVEGGGGLLGALFDAGLVDRIAFFVAPKIIGGTAARPAVEGRGAATLREVFNWDGRWRRVGVNEMLFVGDRPPSVATGAGLR
jgi:diaminohydroxyphosphoribosylaminopyrimidine deaminase/5-amino-6-(5-phosphoribosylamino)uracil reductase